VHARARRLPPEKLAAVRKEFAYLEKMGIIRRSNSSGFNPLHVVPKSDGSFRPCGDFRATNFITVPDRYPVPHIQDFTAALAGMNIFSKIGLVRGYHQVPVAPEDVPKTAFQRLMDQVTQDLLALRLVDLQADRSFVAVALQKLRALSFVGERQNESVLASLHAIDANDVCAELRKQRCTVWAGDVAPEVQD